MASAKQLKVIDYEIAELVVESLRNPAEAPACIPVLSDGLAFIKVGDAWERHIRSRFKDLLDLALKFVSTPFTDEQIEEMERKLWTCKCNLRRGTVPRRFHEKPMAHRSGAVDHSFPRVVMSLASAVCQALEEVTPASLESAGARGKWPPSTAYLLPNGPFEAIKACLQWLKYTEKSFKTQTFPIAFLTSIMKFCPSLRRPVAESTELREYVVRRLHDTVTSLETGYCPPLSFPRPIHSMCHIAQFCEAARDGCDDWSAWLAPVAPTLYADIGRFLAVLPRLDMDEEERADHARVFGNIERSVWDALPSDTRPARDWPSLDAALADLARPHNLLFKKLADLQERRECMSPICFRPAEYQPAGMRVCQCRVAAYCHRNCQREHWRWKRAPHKDTCADIGKAYEAFKEVPKEVRYGLSEEGYLIFREGLEEVGYDEDRGVRIFQALEELEHAREALLQKKTVVVRR
ncbi:hypothetical protein HDZ31DRAFT_83098 [Schizophyllum fasciatum]